MTSGNGQVTLALTDHKGRAEAFADNLSIIIFGKLSTKLHIIHSLCLRNVKYFVVHFDFKLSWKGLIQEHYQKYCRPKYFNDYGFTRCTLLLDAWMLGCIVWLLLNFPNRQKLPRVF